MKTAVTMLGEAFRQWQKDWESYDRGIGDKPKPYDEFISPFIELEKEQIVSSVHYGQNNHTASVYDEGELYYSEIYNRNAQFIKSSIPNGVIQVNKPMKFYTEEQVKESFKSGFRLAMETDGGLKEGQEKFINSLTPIELPSDEEIEVERKRYGVHGSYFGLIQA